MRATRVLPCQAGDSRSAHLRHAAKERHEQQADTAGKLTFLLGVANVACVLPRSFES